MKSPPGATWAGFYHWHVVALILPARQIQKDRPKAVQDAAWRQALRGDLPGGDQKDLETARVTLLSQ